MLSSLFGSLFDTTVVSALSIWDFLVVIAVSLAIGAFLAAVHAHADRSSRSFVATITLLPAIVAVVIMMVNGNIGAGVAVAGAFSLVRFRSAPGTAREICTIFLAMGAGLVCGMGYLAYAVLFALVLGGAMMGLERLGLGGAGTDTRMLHITIPEDLDYAGEFDDLFDGYCASHELVSVKTTNMGSLFKLTYTIVMRDPSQEKAFIDQLRCRNGNLEISITQREVTGYEL